MDSSHVTGLHLGAHMHTSGSSAIARGAKSMTFLFFGGMFFRDLCGEGGVVWVGCKSGRLSTIHVCISFLGVCSYFLPPPFFMLII